MDKDKTKEFISYLNIFSKLTIVTPIDILVIIMIALFLIGLVIDTMITHTFPAYTLIAGIIIITVSYCKISLKIKEILKTKQNKKEDEKLFDEIYHQKEPIFELFEEKEIQLLKRFIAENRLYIVGSFQEANLCMGIANKSIDIFPIHTIPQTNNSPKSIIKISQQDFNLLKKFFEKQKTKTF